MTTLSIVIPSYQRSAILLKTIDQLLQQTVAAQELIIVDQTDYQEGDTNLLALQQLEANRKIRLIRPAKPSIPAAMNTGLLTASAEFVLFLDDDIRVKETFLAAHLQALITHRHAAHVGQILQPTEKPVLADPDYQAGQGLGKDLQFAFNSSQPAEIYNCMAGNLCVRRAAALTAGGFDENFFGAAYRFETEFCRRLIRHTGTPFYFAPEATIDHLRYHSGGTRAVDSYLTSRLADHSVGDYYFALLEARGIDRWRYIASRLAGSVVARFYIRKPWFIPGRWLAEVRGLLLALNRYRHGQALIELADHR